MDFYENDHRNFRISHEKIKKKLKMKVSMGNLKIDFISIHLIKFNKTNLSVQEPHKIIISNKKTRSLLYDDEDKKRSIIFRGRFRRNTKFI